MHIGSFNSEEKAALAYDNTMLKLYPYEAKYLQLNMQAREEKRENPCKISES